MVHLDDLAVKTSRKGSACKTGADLLCNVLNLAALGHFKLTAVLQDKFQHDS